MIAVVGFLGQLLPPAIARMNREILQNSIVDARGLLGIEHSLLSGRAHARDKPVEYLLEFRSRADGVHGARSLNRGRCEELDALRAQDGLPSPAWRLSTPPRARRLRGSNKADRGQRSLPCGRRSCPIK